MVTNSETNEEKTKPRQILDLMLSGISDLIRAHQMAHPEPEKHRVSSAEFVFNQFIYPIESLVNPDPSIFNSIARHYCKLYEFEPNEIPPNYLKQIEVVENEEPPEKSILRDATEELTRVMDFAQASPRTPTKETFSIDARHCHTSEVLEIVETVSIQVKTTN